MKTEQMGTQVEESYFQLVKFEGDPPRAGELKEPAEIIEGGAKREARVTYRAGAGRIVKLFTANDDGYAVLAQERARENREGETSWE